MATLVICPTPLDILIFWFLRATATKTQRRTSRRRKDEKSKKEERNKIRKQAKGNKVKEQKE